MYTDRKIGITTHSYREKYAAHRIYRFECTKRDRERERESEREGSVGNRIFVKESDVVIVACDRK